MMEYSLEEEAPQEFKQSTLAIHSADQKPGNAPENVAILNIPHSTTINNKSTSDKTSNNCVGGTKLITIPQSSK